MDLDNEAIRWARAPGVILCAGEGECTLLVRESWSAIRLDDVSTSIWDALRAPMTTAELVGALVRCYDVTPARCRTDILPILVALHEAGAVVPDAVERGGV